MRGGEKSWSWIKKGIPLRLEIGPREVDAEQLNLCRTRQSASRRQNPFAPPTRSRDRFDSQRDPCESLRQSDPFPQPTYGRDRFSKKNSADFFTGKGEEIHGGFALCHWNEDPAIEAKIKEDFNVTIRCIPIDMPAREGSCLFTGQKSPRRVIFAKSY